MPNAYHPTQQPQQAPSSSSRLMSTSSGHTHNKRSRQGKWLFSLLVPLGFSLLTLYKEGSLRPRSLNATYVQGVRVMNQKDVDSSANGNDRHLNLLREEATIITSNSTTTSSHIQEEEETLPVPPTIHVLFGMHGARPEFIDEFEVALKSVLLHAPLENGSELQIHIVANGEAHAAVLERLQRHSIIGSEWRIPIAITIYNVERRQEEFQSILQKALRGHALDRRVSLGGYYRLLAPLVLSPGTGPVLYMDLDAVILANLQHLWQHVNASHTFQVSAKWLCSAFIIINIDKAGSFWQLLDQLPSIDSGGDQALLAQIQTAHPEIFGSLPPAWDTHLGHGFRPSPASVLEKRKDGVGMLHFNGVRPNYFSGATGLQQYCDRTPKCRDHPDKRKIFERTWMLADYYIRLPWEWAKFQGASQIDPRRGGYPLMYHEVISNTTTTTTFNGNDGSTMLASPDNSTDAKAKRMRY